MKNNISAPLPFGDFCFQWPPGNVAIAPWQHFSRPTREDPWSLYCKSLNFTLAQHTCIEWLQLLSLVLSLLYEDFSLIVNIGQPVFSTHLCVNWKITKWANKSHRNDFYWQGLIVFLNTFPHLVFFSFDFSPSSSLIFAVLWKTLKT